MRTRSLPATLPEAPILDLIRAQDLGARNEQEEEEGGAHSLKDVCDLRRPAPSPFSSRRVMFENEQVK